MTFRLAGSCIENQKLLLYNEPTFLMCNYRMYGFSSLQKWRKPKNDAKPPMTFDNGYEKGVHASIIVQTQIAGIPCKSDSNA